MPNQSILELSHSTGRHGLTAHMPAEGKLPEGIAFRLLVDLDQDMHKAVAALRNLATILDEMPKTVWQKDLSDNESGVIIEGDQYFHFDAKRHIT